MFGRGGLYMKKNAYVLEGRNEELPEWGREGCFFIFDCYDMKSLWGKFGYDIFTGFKMVIPQIWNADFLVVLWIEIEDL